MNAYAQQDQSGAYGSNPSGNYAGSYGSANAYPPDPSQHPAGANPYAQNPSRQKNPGSEYGGSQKPPASQFHHGDEYDPSGNQGLQEEHEHEPGLEPEPEEKDAVNGNAAEHAGGKKIAPVQKRQVPSEYSQDPHHHNLMKHYAKASSKLHAPRYHLKKSSSASTNHWLSS